MRVPAIIFIVAFSVSLMIPIASLPLSGSWSLLTVRIFLFGFTTLVVLLWIVEAVMKWYYQGEVNGLEVGEEGQDTPEIK